MKGFIHNFIHGITAKLFIHPYSIHSIYISFTVQKQFDFVGKYVVSDES